MLCRFTASAIMVVRFQLAFGALYLAILGVQAGNDVVYGQQKQNADPEAGRRRKDGKLAQGCGLLDGGDKQAPHRDRHHHLGSKAGE